MDKAGVYIHIPFCTQKCNYCDFYSIKTDSTLVENFLDAAIRELSFYSDHPVFSKVEFVSIYLGGGTPSLLTSNQISRLLEQIKKQFHFTANIEFTIEANPESLSLAKLKQYHKIGVNRLSLGVQSFNDLELNRLSRIHDSNQAIRSVEWAYQAGFDNVSIDLIFAIPGQTQAQWKSNLLQAIELKPQHLSTYCLTIAPGTPLEKKVINGQEEKAFEETERKMYLSTIEILSEHGFYFYEISNFAKDGYECRHNKMYWNLSPYLGIGPSAHSYWENQRQWNVCNVDKYLELIKNKKRPVAEFENISADQQKLEFIFLSLRKSTGIDVQKFYSIFQISFLDVYNNAIKKLESYPGARLFTFDNNHFQLTAEGFVLYNEVCSFFV